MKRSSSPPKAHSEIEIVRLVWLAIFISVFSFLFYYRHGDLLLYGDAVAHINIARRVFDSRTPGLLQLGTVWLPLPHLLMLPFIVSKQMWQSGAGGSIPSMAAYVLGVLGIFRLVRTLFSHDGKVDGAARVGAWAAAIIYCANPNLIYMLAAGSYFLKAAELNVGEANWQGRLWLALALIGSVAAAFRARARVALLLW